MAVPDRPAPLLDPSRQLLDEPLSLWLSEGCPDPDAGGHTLRFELSSRGDRVPGRLWQPGTGAAPHPLILVAHDAGASKEPDRPAAWSPWLRAGAAVAAIDLPLHGERASAKLSRHLLDGLDPAAQRSGAAPPEHRGLWEEFARQAAWDLRRTLDALSGRPEVDTDRCAFAGFGLGAMVGVLFCAADPRPRAVALAGAGGGFGPPSVDPCRHVGAIAPRPALFVHAAGDEALPRSAAEALHAAAGEPKRVDWLEDARGALADAAIERMARFLLDQLERPG